jgi:hypothetical protein
MPRIFHSDFKVILNTSRRIPECNSYLPFLVIVIEVIVVIIGYLRLG